jgi:heptosyltransferase-1
VYVVPRKQKTRDFLRFCRDLRKNQYDVVLDFHGGPRASWLTFFSKARLKVGYRIKYRNFIYDIALPRSRKNGHYHSVENHINLVKALGVSVAAAPDLFLPRADEAEIRKISKFIESQGLADSKRIILHIGAANQFRNWGEDNIIELTTLLAGVPGVKIILIGAEEDKRAEKTILDRGPSGLVSLVGRLNLRELRELILKASLFVGPDSGPMHIAASTSTPIIAYFGPNLPVYNSPWKSEYLLVEKKLDCRPCKQRQCIHEDFRCMRTISPEEVFRACLSLLEKNAKSAAET